MTIEITPQTTVSDLLAACPDAIPLFLKHKMGCVGCDMSQFETLKDAASIYRVDLSQLMDEIFQIMLKAREKLGGSDECN